MDVLVSFCNVKVPGQAVLGLLDTDTFRFRVLQMPGEFAPRVGITGLAASPHYVYAAVPESPPAPSELLVLDRADLTLLNHYVFQSVVDAHSCWLSGDVLYVVSTGTDELVELRMRGPDVLSEAVFWRPEPGAPRADHHHLNAVYGWGGHLLVSGFGKKAGPQWSSATNGFIINVSRGERLASDLYHPHSLVARGSTLLCCESCKMAVRVIGEERAQRLPGYTRGLGLAESQLFAGTSSRRPVSKSTGVINNPAQTGIPEGRCTVSRLSVEGL